MSMKKILVALAEGSEELEFISITNPLRRAGNEVITASASTSRHIHCARKTEIVVDRLLSSITDDEIDSFDAIVLPGGMPGATNLQHSKDLVKILKNQHRDNKLIAAVCASPAEVLASLNLLNNCSKATCYPSFSHKLGDKYVKDANVVFDERANILTATGPATSLEFGIKLVEILNGKEKANEIGSAMLFY